MRISQKEIQKSYAVLKKSARQSLNAGNIAEALQTIRNCEVLAEQFNWIYADAEIEQMLKEIGENLVPTVTQDYTPKEEKVVLYDDFCVTYVLGVQYIEALLKAGKEVLFLTCKSYKDSENGKNFDNYIRTYKGLIVVQINEADVFVRAQKLYNTIVDFQPSKLFLHKSANSAIDPILYRLPKQITRYLINLQDQTYWLGVGAIDNSIEFRPFGAAISLERRGLKKEQLLMLPFYPIQDKNPFEGFPKEADGHLTIFSGGEVYKSMDSKRTYWKLIKWLLNTYPDVRFLFAAKGTPVGDAYIQDFVKTNHFEDRFMQIGFRKDIYEVLGHCDIYMGTSPTSGSLMSQLAAINGKPILQYYYPGTPDDETEQALCINDTFPISFQDEEAFKQEACRLITDTDYRKRQGERIRMSMIQPEQFNAALKQLMETNESPFPVMTCEVNHQLIEERWYGLEKKGYLNTFAYVCGLLQTKGMLTEVPSLYIKKQLERLINKSKYILNI